MKKLLTTLLCAMLTLGAFAQTEHLTFKGVPIDGSLDEFVDKMRDVGFRYLGTQDGTAILTGDFAGFKGCTIGVNTLEALDIVSMIGVIFPEDDDWGSLAGAYENLKSMLTQKYGRYNECVEEFQGYTEPKDDNMRLIKLKMDNCVWYTIYSTDKGDIELSIDHNGTNSCFVLLRYFDKINTQSVQQRALEDL